MNESFYEGLKRVNCVGGSDSDANDAAVDTCTNPVLDASGSEDSGDIPSDDSAIVDLARVEQLGTTPVGEGSSSAGENGEAEEDDPLISQPSTSRPRRSNYATALARIAAFNRDESDEGDVSQESDVQAPARKKKRVSLVSAPSSRPARLLHRNSSHESSYSSGSGDESSDETTMAHKPKTKRSEATRKFRGRGGISVVGGHSGGSRSLAARQNKSRKAAKSRLDDRLDYYGPRPSIGARRRHPGPDCGTQQNGIFYGPGTIVGDNWLQPRVLHYPKVKIMPEGYGWRGRPARKPMHFDFTPKRPPGVHHLEPEMSCADLFEEFWREPERIWRNATNDKGRELCAKSGAQFREVTELETRAFVACKMWIDLFRKPELRMYWCRVNDFASPFIQRVRETTGMSHRRFQQITQWTRLYDKNFATATGMCDPRSLNYDVCHKAREYIECINRSCEKFFEPDEILAIDESMLEYTGIGGEKQTIKSKPTPTGLMLYACCSKGGYFLRMLLHMKQTLPYWEEMGVPFATVWALLSGCAASGLTNYLDTGRTCITDRAYTSVQLAYSLAFRKTYFIGTVKRALKCVPDCQVKEEQKDGSMKSVNQMSKRNTDRGDTYFLHDTENVVSFCAWQDSKIVPVIYTHPVGEEMTTCTRLVKGGTKEGTEFSRPKLLEIYDNGMGGVDLGDQHMAAQHRPSRCYVWYTPLLFRSFDVFANNVFCVKREFGTPMSMFDVKMSIAYGMLERVQRMAGTWRPANSNTYADVVAPVIHNPYTVVSELRAPCVVCKLRVSSGCETCAVPCHMNDCWKEQHRL